jgi:hypothetical protein
MKDSNLPTNGNNRSLSNKRYREYYESHKKLFLKWGWTEEDAEAEAKTMTKDLFQKDKSLVQEKDTTK